MKTVLLIHLASTGVMIGIIWFVQVVHYPLFRLVGAEGYGAYQAAHERLVTVVVALPMLLELATGLLLVWRPPEGIHPILLWIGLALIAIIWLATAVLQVPRHATLRDGFDATVHHTLVVSNWIRTAAWTARGLLVLWIMALALR